MFVCLHGLCTHYHRCSLNKSKKSVYKFLISLPKNVVSSVSESLKMMNKNTEDETNKYEDDDTELNKKDENIVKSFHQVIHHQ